MSVWLLVLFLLIITIYFVSKFFITHNSSEVKKTSKHHYTFKI